MRCFGTALAAGLVMTFLLVSPGLSVYIITDADITATTGNEVGSGNGTLDLLLLTESAGGSQNSGSGFDGDNANTDMPTGGGAGRDTANESYITSFGDLRDFYSLNFPNGPQGSFVNRMVLSVDLNQTTGTDVTLDDLIVLIDYDTTFGDDRDNPAGTDISSALQNRTGDTYTGGTILAQLEGPKILALNEQGAGWADYLIDVGIDPFDSAFSDDTRILVHWESSNHDDGGETVFLSGTYTSVVPEPSMFGVLTLGALALLRKKQR